MLIIFVIIYLDSLGETCSCAASIMFKVEAAVRIGLTSAAYTSEACRYRAHVLIILVIFTFKLTSSFHANVANSDDIVGN